VADYFAARRGFVPTGDRSRPRFGSPSAVLGSEQSPRVSRAGQWTRAVPAFHTSGEVLPAYEATDGYVDQDRALEKIDVRKGKATSRLELTRDRTDVIRTCRSASPSTGLRLTPWSMGLDTATATPATRRCTTPPLHRYSWRTTDERERAFPNPLRTSFGQETFRSGNRKLVDLGKRLPLRTFLDRNVARSHPDFRQPNRIPAVLHPISGPFHSIDRRLTRNATRFARISSRVRSLRVSHRFTGPILAFGRRESGAAIV
jgi:hypothetical protein